MKKLEENYEEHAKKILGKFWEIPKKSRIRPPLGPVLGVFGLQQLVGPVLGVLGLQQLGVYNPHSHTSSRKFD